MPLLDMFTPAISSCPDPSIYAEFGKDMDDWNCGAWIVYSDRLIAAYGKDRAEEILNIDFSNLGMFASANWCMYNCDWVRYFRRTYKDIGQGFFSKIFCVAETVVETAGTTARTIKWLVPVVLVGGTVAIVAANWDKIKKIGRVKGRKRRERLT